ncbi:hypothetical protein [Acinetobacter guillouiae]|uniref:hypothetical protein n=1 Tax=Acinetobacter guillouiae TaxID=106649 RepID=UPI0002D0C2F5|nr:hypothetical protein [Acinetobacter guillouiae]ENU56778.1 hypothetical protein F981_04286 [Acinetobacter guillouiae CIP 63.46]KAB0623650.1 hypothetical protein F7P82_20410 [Acinetobacter guillouiae]
MTTINNSENLIEKVGGIEKAREVVEGAPTWATTYCMAYAAYGGTFHWYGACKNCYVLPALRTAIAEHDLKQCQHGYDIACLICGFGNENGVRVWRNQIESDEVTDIRNHLSPSTLVIDHE